MRYPQGATVHLTECGSVARVVELLASQIVLCVVVPAGSRTEGDVVMFTYSKEGEEYVRA